MISLVAISLSLHFNVFTCCYGECAHVRLFCAGICTSQMAVVLRTSRLAVSSAGGGEHF